MAARTDTALANVQARITESLATQPELISLWLDLAPAYVDAMTPQQLERWSRPVEELGRHAPALAEAYLRAYRLGARLTAPQVIRWGNILMDFARLGWRATELACRMPAYADSMLGTCSLEDLARFAALLHRIAEQDIVLAGSCLDLSRIIFETLPADRHKHFLALAETVAARSPADTWTCFETGSELFIHLAPGMAEYFSDIARQIVAQPDDPPMPLLCEMAAALAGMDADSQDVWLGYATTVCQLDPPAAGALLRQAPGLDASLSPRQVEVWVNRGLATARAAEPGARAATCRGYFRLASTAATRALAEMSPGVAFDQAARLLELFGQALAGDGVKVKPPSDERDPNESRVIRVPSLMNAFATRSENLGAYKACIGRAAVRLQCDDDPMPQSINSLSDKPLATALYHIVADSRIDAAVRDEYPGLAAPLDQLNRHAVAARSPPESLALRQAFIENLVRASLNATDTVSWPLPLHHLMLVALGVLGMSIRDSPTADLAHWLYQLGSAIPNIENPACPGPWRPIKPNAVPAFDTLPPIPQLPAALPADAPCVEMTWPDPPQHRRQWVPGSLPTAAEVTESPPDEALPDADLADAVVSEDKDAEVVSADNGEPVEDQDIAEEKLISWYRYDEWDCNTHDYKPGWCRLGERTMAPGAIADYNDILARQHALVTRIRRQFEMMKPEQLRRVRNLHDGHDIDLEQAIRFYVDRKAGAGPAARFYTRRDKIERSVAAAFLLDLSQSTSEPVAGKRDTRIIDVERDAVVLIIEALEAVGDTYGIFGFSGRGRDNVAFYTIKGLTESFGDAVKQRAANIEPLSATRMGAAIRHTQMQLAAVPASVKLLMIISDGRPQDREYGDPEDPSGYGIHDTRQALIEARRAGITPFLLTVDRQGPDYLADMCHEFGYEIVSDVASLPARLPTLYRYLAGN